MAGKIKTIVSIIAAETVYIRHKMLSEDKYPEELSRMYRKRMGKELNLNPPETFNEKIQWNKLYNRDPLRSLLADKYRVRDWVKDKIGEEYLVPLLGAWDRFDDIDFSKLPSQFALKLNNGYATNIIVEDKEHLDIKWARKKFKRWMKNNLAFRGFEMQYKDIQPKIIAEKYIAPEGGDLPDYKFFCFDGRVFCSYTMMGYTRNHREGRLGFFDRDYKLMPYHRLEYKPITEQLEPPQNYVKMVELAEKLSEGIDQVRVDFYNLDGKIYFGEMTLTTACGFCKFQPEEFDKILGEQWVLDKKWGPGVKG